MYDKELVALLKNGLQPAFQELYIRYKEKLTLFCKRMLRDESRAEDVAHDVFLQVLEMPDSLLPEKSFCGYLQTIAQNRILDEFKRAKVHLRFAQYTIKHGHDATNQTENQVIDNDYEKLLSELIDGLTPRQKEVFRLSRIQGLAYKEIAEKLHISLPAVKKHASLSLEKIKTQLTKYTDIDLKTIIVFSIFFS
jgi:RNA polymerase sigma-70 factor (ECF subfamily)